MQKITKISLVIPVYNEAGIIEPLVRSYYKNLIRKIPQSEFIIAEDGSTDGTKGILKELNKKIPFVLVMSSKRKGYNMAVKDALKIPKNNIIFFSDSSGQHEPKDFFELSKYINDFDIIIGYKSSRQDPYYRVFLSRWYNVLVRMLFGLKLRDINCGFRIVKKSVIDDVLRECKTFEKYCAFSEFTLRAYKKKYRIKEVPIHHYRRHIGEKKSFFIWNIILVVFIVIWDLIRLRAEMSSK